MEIERIEKAIYSGETIRVRYFGGSTPGAERQIKPTAVVGDSVQAHCLLTSQTKKFKLANLEEALEGVPSQMAQTFMPPAPGFETIQAFAASCTADVEALGWVAQLDGDRFSLHRRFKNGKPVKGGDVSISYESMTHDLVFDGENIVETNHRPRERPWGVWANKQTPKTFGNAARAQELFLTFARQLAPAPCD